jgi:hypothetical protein
MQQLYNDFTSILFIIFSMKLYQIYILYVVELEIIEQ